jgi:hypothetical protein
VNSESAALAFGSLLNAFPMSGLSHRVCRWATVAERAAEGRGVSSGPDLNL